MTSAEAVLLAVTVAATELDILADLPGLYLFIMVRWWTMGEGQADLDATIIVLFSDSALSNSKSRDAQDF